MNIQEQEVTARKFLEPEATSTMITETEPKTIATMISETDGPEATATMITEGEEPENTATMITKTEDPEATATMITEGEPETTAFVITETEDPETTATGEPDTTATMISETEPEATANMITETDSISDIETEPEATANMITETDSISDIETEYHAANESHWTSDALTIFLHQKKFEEAAEETHQKYHQLHEQKKAEILKKAEQAIYCLDSWSEQNRVEFIASSYYDYLENVLADYCKQSKDMFVSYVSSTRTAMVMLEEDIKIACRSTKQSQKRVEKNNLKIVMVVFVSFLLLVATLSFVLRHEW